MTIFYIFSNAFLNPHFMILQMPMNPPKHTRAHTQTMHFPSNRVEEWKEDKSTQDLATGQPKNGVIIKLDRNRLSKCEGPLQNSAKSFSTCAKCPPNHFLKYDGRECVTECGTGYYAEGNTCKPCHFDCLECSSSTCCSKWRKRCVMLASPDHQTVCRDSDNDGIDDKTECGGGSTANCPDTDGDGVQDSEDNDADGDLIPDDVECPTQPCLDSDSDGVPDYKDGDSDGDTISDAVEAGCDKGEERCVPRDTDNDGTPDYLDGDSDGDGTLDIDERGPRYNYDLLHPPPNDFADAKTRCNAQGKTLGLPASMEDQRRMMALVEDSKAHSNMGMWIDLSRKPGEPNTFLNSKGEDMPLSNLSFADWAKFVSWART